MYKLSVTGLLPDRPPIIVTTNTRSWVEWLRWRYTELGFAVFVEFVPC